MHEKHNVALLRWLDPVFLVIIPITLSNMNCKDALNKAENLTVPTVLVGINKSFKKIILYRLSLIKPADRTWSSYSFLSSTSFKQFFGSVSEKSEIYGCYRKRIINYAVCVQETLSLGSKLFQIVLWVFSDNYKSKLKLSEKLSQNPLSQFF